MNVQYITEVAVTEHQQARLSSKWKINACLWHSAGVFTPIYYFLSRINVKKMFFQYVKQRT